MRWSWPRSLLLAAVGLTFAVGALYAQGPGSSGAPYNLSLTEPHSMADLYGSLRDVINYGAELFNKQADHAGCYRVYQGALISIRPFMAPAVRKRIDESIVRAEGMPYYSERAFELRRTLDEIRAKAAPGKGAPPTVARPRTEPPKVGVPTSTPYGDPPAQIPPRVELPRITETPRVDPPKVQAPTIAPPTIPNIGPPIGLPKSAKELPGIVQPKADLPKIDLPSIKPAVTEKKKIDPPKIDLPPIKPAVTEKTKIDPPRIDLPPIKPAAPEKKKTDPPKIDLPEVNLPPVTPAQPQKKKVDPPKIDLPTIDLPKVDKPNVPQPKPDLPKVERKTDAPKIEIPMMDLPKDPLPIAPPSTPPSTEIKDKKVKPAQAEAPADPPPMPKKLGEPAKDGGVVHGTVLLDGKPLAHGFFITLVSKDGKRISTIVHKEGCFDFTKALPLGTYRVAIEALPGDTTKAALVPMRYRDETTSGLTVQVNAARVTPELRLAK